MRAVRRPARPRLRRRCSPSRAATADGGSDDRHPAIFARLALIVFVAVLLQARFFSVSLLGAVANVLPVIVVASACSAAP